jgi:hypothetical protein
MGIALKRLSAIALAAALGAAAFAFVTPKADAHHEPANKFAAAGSDIDEVTTDAEPILSETMKISTPYDLVLSASAECTILTELTTGPDDAPGSSDSAFALGAVRMWVTIDGKRVAVATNDALQDNDDEVEDANDTSDIGEVTFCNRAYQRTVSDGEDPQDGIDEEHDYIRTRTANAFNWVALDVGRVYDNPVNGNNIVNIQLWADYDTSTSGEAVADAFVGTRTLIAEPTNASVHEQVQPQGGAGS